VTLIHTSLAIKIATTNKNIILKFVEWISHSRIKNI